ncbi:MAG: YbaK/EbsC family protein [Patescibacteria group bacterium]|nr:YbaK/EbsC family protein [Patescibacteria group bacterium]
MPIPAKVKAYLKKAKKPFEEITHKTVFTAYDIAQTLKRNLKEVGKTLLVKTDKAYVLVVVPASHRLDFAKLKKALKVKKVEMVPEKVMAKMLKVKAGALTAFGKLHKLPLVVDRSLLKTKDVILQAGSFTDSVRMKVKDFVKMEEALMAGIVEAAGMKVGKSKGKKKTK